MRYVYHFYIKVCSLECNIQLAMCIPSKTAVSDVFEAINVNVKPIMKFKEKVNKEACLYVASLSQSDFEQFFWDEDEIRVLVTEELDELSMDDWSEDDFEWIDVVFSVWYDI